MRARVCVKSLRPLIDEDVLAGAQVAAPLFEACATQWVGRDLGRGGLGLTPLSHPPLTSAAVAGVDFDRRCRKRSFSAGLCVGLSRISRCAITPLEALPVPLIVVISFAFIAIVAVHVGSFGDIDAGRARGKPEHCERTFQCLAHVRREVNQSACLVMALRPHSASS